MIRSERCDRYCVDTRRLGSRSREAWIGVRHCLGPLRDRRGIQMRRVGGWRTAIPRENDVRRAAVTRARAWPTTRMRPQAITASDNEAGPVAEVRDARVGGAEPPGARRLVRGRGRLRR